MESSHVDRLEHRVATLESEITSLNAANELRVEEILRRDTYQCDQLLKQLQSAEKQRRVLIEGGEAIKKNAAAEIRERERKIEELKRMLNRSASASPVSYISPGGGVASSDKEVQRELEALRDQLEMQQGSFTHALNELRIELEYATKSKNEEQTQDLKYRERGAQLSAECNELKERLVSQRKELDLVILNLQEKVNDLILQKSRNEEEITELKRQLLALRPLKPKLVSSPSKLDLAAEVDRGRKMNLANQSNSARELNELETIVSEQAGQIREADKKMRDSTALLKARTADRQRLMQEAVDLRNQLAEVEKSA